VVAIGEVSCQRLAEIDTLTPSAGPSAADGIAVPPKLVHPVPKAGVSICNKVCVQEGRYSITGTAAGNCARGARLEEHERW